MVLAMSRPFKHPKTGVYWLRKRLPADIAGSTGRSIITKTLGTKDPEEAKRKHAAVLAELEFEWAQIRLRGRAQIDQNSPNAVADTDFGHHTARYITDREAHLLAKPIHDKWLADFHENPSEQLHWHTNLYEGMWTTYPLPQTEPIPGVEGIADAIPGTVPIENILWKSMRTRCVESARGILLENGFMDDQWSIHKTSRAVAAALQTASLTLQRLELGNFETGEEPAVLNRPRPKTGQFSVQSHDTKLRPSGAAIAATTLTGLVESWWRESKAAGRKPSTYDSYRNTIVYLVRFLEHDDASKVTMKDVVAFKDHRLTTPSPKTGKMVSAKTVKTSTLSALKVVFDWGVKNGLLAHNPAASVSLRLGKQARLRSKSLTDIEAKAILCGALTHQRGQENSKTFAAKRWIPWLCAFTGARVGELAQLRKEDVSQRADLWVIRITPEAGTVKTNEAREIPIHQQLIDLGFSTFVQEAGNGHLFLNVGPSENPRGALRGLKNRLAEFGRTFVSDPEVAPNHGWRHRFKTVGMEAGISPRILDAIQGQAPRTVADTYGEVTIKTMAAEIAKLPSCSLKGLLLSVAKPPPPKD